MCMRVCVGGRRSCASPRHPPHRALPTVDPPPPLPPLPYPPYPPSPTRPPPPPTHRALPTVCLYHQPHWEAAAEARKAPLPHLLRVGGERVGVGWCGRAGGEAGRAGGGGGGGWAGGVPPPPPPPDTLSILLCGLWFHNTSTTHPQHTHPHPRYTHPPTNQPTPHPTCSSSTRVSPCPPINASHTHPPAHSPAHTRFTHPPAHLLQLHQSPPLPIVLEHLAVADGLQQQHQQREGRGGMGEGASHARAADAAPSHRPPPTGPLPLPSCPPSPTTTTANTTNHRRAP